MNSININEGDKVEFVLVRRIGSGYQISKRLGKVLRVDTENGSCSIKYGKKMYARKLDNVELVKRAAS
ncbi:MAG: hypothetical protein CML20_19325 [Rheinheimera sp.]|nr:hypothetical protein [Rheinheimera sp.]|tara:strand:+ start:20105 stop:20308 length:204 start_codon:yes stop_codon:yes gene_type:complete